MNKHNECDYKWKELKDQYIGERVFLIGNGPSLNKTPLYLLKNEYTMTFNHFYLMNERLNWKPSFYACIDNLLLDDIVPSIDTIKKYVGLVFIPDIHPAGKIYYTKIKNQDKIFWIKHLNGKAGKGFSTNLPFVYKGGTVIYEGLQILRYMGFKKIYLIGVDMNYKTVDSVKVLDDGFREVIATIDDDPNHFDPRYFGKNKKYHQPENFLIERNLYYLRNISKLLSLHDMEIINAGYNSKVDAFPFESYTSLFDFNEAAILELFNDSLKQNTNFSTLSELYSSCIEITNINNWSSRIGNFYADTDIGIQILPKAIFSHIPFGPYKDKYYFVVR